MDIILLQEHNVKDIEKVHYLSDRYVIIFNHSICLKGGTCILIRKGLDFNIKHVERSGDSRICSVYGDIHGSKIRILNVYAPSGKNLAKEREEFFDNELPYYLRFDNSQTVLGGDWNCVLSPRDVSNGNDLLVSKSPLKLVRDLRFNDTWFLHNRQPQYTFVRNNYGSRIDRFYCQALKTNVNSCEIIPVSFSDHSAVMIDVKVNPAIKVGKCYWKLNTNLLHDEDIREKFKKLWIFLKSKINNYRNISNWWSDYVKQEIKYFFVREGKRKSKERYGMINYLETKLRKQHLKLNTCGTLNYEELKTLKDQINNLKSLILEGVKVRGRIQEQVEGEKVSSYLLGQQRSTSCRKIMTEVLSEKDIIPGLSENVSFKESHAIQHYVTRYYEKLYKSTECNLDSQNYFLEFIESKVNASDNDFFIRNLSYKEIHDIIFSMANNKCPGIDGIPIEFYKYFWDEIKQELKLIIGSLLFRDPLSAAQRLAVITLASKGSDDKILSNWRPISLLCCDYKIVAKILVKRLQLVADKVIAPEQFCLPGRSINTCNILLRDIIYYCNVNKIQGAIINLDWSKAFDRVDMEFVYKILNKLGFSHQVISIIRKLYGNTESCCMINGNIGKPFTVGRGVRQGCPLSMFIYAIFQELIPSHHR